MVKKTSPSPEKSSKDLTDPVKEVAREFLVRNALGLHARAAALLVKITSRYRSEITLRKDSLEVNGKSIMEVLMLAAGRGSKILVRAKGEDAQETMEELGRLFDNQFGEK
mgnify:CR=1 FL=1